MTNPSSLPQPFISFSPCINAAASLCCQGDSPKCKFDRITPLLKNALAVPYCLERKSNSLIRSEVLLSSCSSVFSIVISHDFPACTQQSRQLYYRHFPGCSLATPWSGILSPPTLATSQLLQSFTSFTEANLHQETFTNSISYTSGVSFLSWLLLHTKPDLVKEQMPLPG